MTDTTNQDNNLGIAPTQPNILLNPIGYGGTVNTDYSVLPAGASETTDVVASLKYSFPQLTSVDPSNNGVYVTRQDMNGIIYYITQRLSYIQQGYAISPYSTNTDNGTNSGYQSNAMVTYNLPNNSGLGIAYASADNTVSAPTGALTSTTSWRNIVFDSLSSVNYSGLTYTPNTNTLAVASRGGQQLFLTTGTQQTFTVPAGVTTIYISGCGGGGGGSIAPSEASGGTGAGGAASCHKAIFSVTGSQQITLVVGAAGVGQQMTVGTSGGATTFIIGTTTYTLGGGVNTGAGGVATSSIPNSRNGGSGAVGGVIIISGTSLGVGGSGGGSIFGAGGSGGIGGQAPNNASGYGGGGGSSGFFGGSPTGANGTQGFLLIEW